MSFFYDNFIVDFMRVIFNSIHGVVLGMLGLTPETANGLSYVLAIFLLTLGVKLLILPLSIKSSKSNAKLQEIQPEMQKLQKKYANDPQKAQMEISKLMKENNVSMFGGCLPMLIPFPILFALYGVFMQLSIPAGADPSFLWVKNVMAPDTLFILPILAALSTYIPSMMMSKTMNNSSGGPNMNTMNLVMSGMMGFMAINFQSLLVIYWIISGSIQLVQTYFINYLPAKKKLAEKAEKESVTASERAKKATPKSKVRK